MRQDPHIFQQLSSETLKDIRWTCASVAVRCYLKNRTFNSCVRLLTEMAEWESNYSGGKLLLYVRYCYLNYYYMFVTYY